MALHKTKHLHIAVLAVAALILGFVLSTTLFRPEETLATHGPASVVCGSPDPLMSNMSTGYARRFDYGGSNPASSKRLVTCTAEKGGTTKYLALRRSLKDASVSYRITVDGVTIMTITNPSDIGDESHASVGWVFGEKFTSTTVPIKFNESLTIDADVKANPRATATSFYAAGHVLFEPLQHDIEIPVKFLTPATMNVGNTPTVNIGNTPTVNIGGQPIHTVTP